MYSAEDHDDEHSVVSDPLIKSSNQAQICGKYWRKVGLLLIQNLIVMK